MGWILAIFKKSMLMLLLRRVRHLAPETSVSEEFLLYNPFVLDPLRSSGLDARSPYHHSCKSRSFEDEVAEGRVIVDRPFKGWYDRSH